MVDYVGQQLGNYRILRLLGAGGFAEVYLGEHIRLNTKAAIKVLHTQLTAEQMEDFLNEARTVARLDHPNIVRVMEFDVQAGVPFLVMTYAPNGTLRQRHPVGQKLALATIIPYVKQVADALQYAHESKLIHRDIKPENILVGQQNKILLSDFGIATIARTSRVDTGQEMAGTAAYMAPEQIQGHARYASDQYSLGIVVYEWLGGDRPFHGTFIETCTQHLFANPPSLRAKSPDVLPDVEHVVFKALQKDASQRFPTVQVFAEALEQASKSPEPTVLAPHRVQPPAVQTCSRCGKPVPPNAAFCGNCGYNFTEAGPTIQRPRDGYAPPIASPHSEQMPVNNLLPQDTTIPVQTADILLHPYPFPARKSGSKRNALIIGAILLIVLVLAVIGVYPYINMYLHPTTANLGCLASTQNLLFGDCFQDNTNKWDLPHQPNQYSANISNPSLILEDDDKTLFAETVPGSPHIFTDFRLEVDADLSSGDASDGYGVIIRATPEASGRFKTYYRFELFGDGSYAIYRGDSSTNDIKLVDFTSNSAIRPQGSINHISITANGTSMTLTVNSFTVKQITDESYNSGNVALFVSDLSTAGVMAQATFSKLGIYKD